MADDNTGASLAEKPVRPSEPQRLDTSDTVGGQSNWHDAPESANVHELAGQSNGSDEEEAGEEIEPGARKEYFLLPADAPHHAFHRALRHSAILGLLAFSAIWGTLAREGLVALNTYSGMSVEPTIWAQAVGCLIMGWTVANKDVLEAWYPPAFVMLGTGFCGSLTTFSSFILHVFQAYSNEQHYNRHGLHNVMDALSQTALTIGMSLIALAAGRALTEIIPLRQSLHYVEHYTTHRALKQGRRRRRTSKISEADSDDIEPKGAPSMTSVGPDTPVAYSPIPDLIAIGIGVLTWAGAAILCGTYRPFRSVTYAIVLAPPGTILRWYLSRWNSLDASKKRFPYWPLGTLTANLLATAVIAAVFVGQNVGRVPGAAGGGASTFDGCNALRGVQEGFCGCLSTVSTFAVELTNLRPRRRAFFYALGSYAIGIALCVLIIGSPWWTRGMQGSCYGLSI